MIILFCVARIRGLVAQSRSNFTLVVLENWWFEVRNHSEIMNVLMLPNWRIRGAAQRFIQLFKIKPQFIAQNLLLLYYYTDVKLALELSWVIVQTKKNSLSCPS
jgi:hypothetical protein